MRALPQTAEHVVLFGAHREIFDRVQNGFALILEGPDLRLRAVDLRLQRLYAPVQLLNAVGRRRFARLGRIGEADGAQVRLELQALRDMAHQEYAGLLRRCAQHLHRDAVHLRSAFGNHGPERFLRVFRRE